MLTDILNPSMCAAPPLLDASDERAPDADFELAQRAAKGDIAAFEQIYLRHHRRVYSLCLRMTANSANAEDLTQEIFIQLFQKIGTFRGESAFTTWLHRTTVNFVLMQLRRPVMRREHTTEDSETPVQIAHGTANPNQMPVVDRIALDKAIAQLPPGYRTVFVLHDVEGYEHEEIARILKCSVGTSKSQLHKARMKLRAAQKKRAQIFEASGAEPKSKRAAQVLKSAAFDEFGRLCGACQLTRRNKKF
jgi:RNA polymerase sigma-70 factor (ECF subfamily)